MPVSSFSPFLIALAAMLWGTDVLLRPNALAGGWSAAQVVLAEHLLLAAVFAPILWRGRREFRTLGRPEWLVLLAVAWGGSALATWLYTQAFTLDFSQALTVVLLQKIQPLFAILLAGYWLHERHNSSFWAWCGLALVGAILLIGFKAAPSFGDLRVRQALLALCAAGLWGAATVGGRRLTAFLSPPLLAGARFACAIPPLVALALLTPHTAHGHTDISRALGFLALIVLLPDLAGMALYYYGLRGTSASAATLAELCYPLMSLLLGIFVSHTIILPLQWLGFGLLTVAILGLGRKPGVALPAPDAPKWEPSGVS